MFCMFSKKHGTDNKSKVKSAYKSNTFVNLTFVMSVSYYLVPRLIGYLHTQGGIGGWLIGVLKID